MLFEKVVNEDVILEKRDEKHLFSESDFPKFGQKPKLFEARNCYISIEYVNDNDVAEFITDDPDVINELKNKDVYFVEFASTVAELGDKRGTIVVDDVFETFADDMEGAIEYLNAYLIKEGNLNNKRNQPVKFKCGDLVRILENVGGFLTKGKLAIVERHKDYYGNILVKEIDNPYKNTSWWIPKSKVELVEKKIDELRRELYEHCDKTETSRKGIEYLVNYYIHSLGWTEESALIYAIGLFRNDTIRQIKLFGKDGEEI